MSTFKVGDRVNHLLKGMATVVCVNSKEDVLLRLDDDTGNPYSAYRYKYKVANTEAGNWYWNPSVSMYALVHRKPSFKGNIR